MGAYRRILAPVDGSKTSNKGLREAIRLAKSEGAKLFVLHVVSEYPAFAVMDGMMAGAPGADLVPAGDRGRAIFEVEDATGRKFTDAQRGA